MRDPSSPTVPADQRQVPSLAKHWNPMRCRMAPADKNHLANKDSRSFPSYSGVSETHYQGLQSVAASATARKLPRDSCLLKAELPWRRGCQARLTCGSLATHVGRHLSALVGP